jgi:hypothetical protein
MRAGSKYVYKEIYMHTKNFALIGGLVMLMMGLIAFLPSLNVVEGLPPIYLNVSYGMFLDMFPLNILNKLALILFGAFGVGAYFAKENLKYSIMFSKVVFWVMGALAVLGLFSETNTLFGYWPLFGFEIIAHGIFALLGGYFGYVATREETFDHTAHRLHKI